MSWKKGPLPENTWNWGAVVPVGVSASGGFFFADFCGDHVKIVGGGGQYENRTLKAHEVEWYDNSITASPTGVSRPHGSPPGNSAGPTP